MVVNVSEEFLDICAAALIEKEKRLRKKDPENDVDIRNQVIRVQDALTTIEEFLNIDLGELRT